MKETPEVGPQEPPNSFTRDLRALHDVSMELATAKDVQDLCRRAVELGQSVLGFDRLGIWFIDPEKPDWNIGTWGIDEQGKIRDERSSRLRRDPIIATDEFYRGKVPILVFNDGIAYNDRRESVGKADKILAPLWDGRRIIGELSVDNLLTGRPFTEERQEVLIVFARIIAHLSSLKRVEAELRLLASTDSLTGAINRRTTLIILEKQLAACIRKGSPLAIALVDLDDLKAANDQYGHAEGDRYIQDTFQALVNRVRVSDTVGRLGGDEFLVIFPDCEMNEAARILDAVCEVIERPSPNTPYPKSISYGLSSLAEFDDDGCSSGADIKECVRHLMEVADQRMYSIKRQKPKTRS